MKKKVWLLLFLVLAFCQPVFATYYQLLRTGDIVIAGTNTHIISPINMNLTCSTVSFKDRMDTYYLVYANQKNWNRFSLVGCEDYGAANIFDPLVSLNSDRILEKLTSIELKNANVRFVRLKSPMGKLDVYNKNKDFNLDRIAYIDLSVLNYISAGHAVVSLRLKPNTQFENNSYYMKLYQLDIKTLTRKQANRMF